jgi:ABC-type maltose transport system permease subunit
MINGTLVMNYSQRFLETFMTGFEMVSLVIGVAGLIVGSVALPTFVLTWSQASDDQKAKFWGVITKLRKKAYRGWVWVSCAVLVITGIGKVADFVTSSEPMTRLDVFLLLMNLMSLIVFTVTSLILFVIFRLEDKKKGLPVITP